MFRKFLKKPETNQKTHHRIHNISVLIILGYIIMIMVGTILLCLPIARHDHQALFLDSLFTSTSAVSVTGLTLSDTAATYSWFGETVILLLMEIGGLGYMTLAVTMFILMGKNIGIQEKIQFREAQGVTKFSGMKELAKNMVRYALIIEACGIGALWLIFYLDPNIEGIRCLYMAIFHSVSAFCNAGFDLFGNMFYPDCGLAPLNTNYFCLITLAILSILGSFGYIAFKDLFLPEQKRKRSTQTKIVFTTTVSLLAIGTLIFFFAEKNYTMTDMNFWQRLLNSFYLSATSRSTGMGNVNVGEMGIVAYWLLFLLEIIGGSPSGTGGGIKTTTFAILVASVKSTLKKQNDTEMFGRKIHHKYINRAVSIIFMYVFVGLIAIIIIGFTEPNFIPNSEDSLRLQFDIFSALTTSGFSNGIHRSFSNTGLYVFIMLMFIGRVGTLTFFNMLIWNNRKILRKYPEDDITVG